MKIKELKEILKQLPDSMDEVEIYSVMSSGCCGDVEDLEGLDVDFRLPDHKPDSHPHKDSGMLRFYYNSLPGYHSCRQVGLTKKQNEEYWNQFPASKHYKKEEK